MWHAFESKPGNWPLMLEINVQIAIYLVASNRFFYNLDSLSLLKGLSKNGPKNVNGRETETRMKRKRKFVSIEPEDLLIDHGRKKKLNIMPSIVIMSLKKSPSDAFASLLQSVLLLLH